MIAPAGDPGHRLTLAALVPQWRQNSPNNRTRRPEDMAAEMGHIKTRHRGPYQRGVNWNSLGVAREARHESFASRIFATRRGRCRSLRKRRLGATLLNLPIHAHNALETPVISTMCKNG
jgi:hypothetical protein